MHTAAAVFRLVGLVSRRAADGAAAHIEFAARHRHAAAADGRRVAADLAAVHGKLTTAHIHAAAVVRRVAGDAAAVHVKSAGASHRHAAAGLAHRVGDLAVCGLAAVLAVAEGEGPVFVHDDGGKADIRRDAVTVEAEHCAVSRLPTTAQRHIADQIVVAFFAG